MCVQRHHARLFTFCDRLISMMSIQQTAALMSAVTVLCNYASTLSEQTVLLRAAVAPAVNYFGRTDVQALVWATRTYLRTPKWFAERARRRVGLLSITDFAHRHRSTSTHLKWCNAGEWYFHATIDCNLFILCAQLRAQLTLVENVCSQFRLSGTHKQQLMTAAAGSVEQPTLDGGGESGSHPLYDVLSPIVETLFVLTRTVCEIHEPAVAALVHADYGCARAVSTMAPTEKQLLLGEGSARFVISVRKFSGYI
jgi:hypothetical protein